MSIEIEKGEFTGIIGHTGSGKSTLIQHFNGLLKPTSGRIYLDGQDIWEDKSKIRQVRFRVGLVFQYPEYQIFEETVYKDIAFGPKKYEAQRARNRQARQTNRRRGRNFGGASRQISIRTVRRREKTVAIAGVMAMEPEVLILDEPTAGLDPKGRGIILEQIKEYHRNMGCTVLLVSHSMEDVARYASKILVMNKSEIFCYGKPRTYLSSLMK